MCEAELRETRNFAFKMLPPTHVWMLGVPYEELDLVSCYVLRRMTLETPN